ncbi:MAG: hypothetical protein H7X80_05935, partial [bacterium]|nr:hypothetical protein [Candidatus Kapabacteria bacterium]
MSKLCYLVLLLIGFVAPTSVVAQVDSPRGTEFWLTFIDCFTNPGLPTDPTEVLRLEIAAGALDAQCRVEMPAFGWSADVLVTAGTGATV